MTEHNTKTLLDITVSADFIINERIGVIPDNFTERTGATDIVCNSTVTLLTPNGQGSDQPPSQIGRNPRPFDRQLWIRHSWVDSNSRFKPNPSFYGGTSYPPRLVNELTEKYGGSENVPQKTLTL